MPSFVVFIDANVIYPMPLCDTVLRLAQRELFRPVISARVLEEVDRNLVADGRCTKEQASRRIGRIAAFFESAIVADFESLEGGLKCHLKDRHVLAAAIAGGANQIVTNNVGDFSRESTAPFDIEVVPPDVFLQNIFDLYPDATVEEILDQAAALKNPPHTVYDVLSALSSIVPNFAQSVLTEIGRRRGGLGRVGATIAAELRTLVVMKARTARRDTRIESGILVVDQKTALIFARNAGMFRLQFAVDRLGVEELRELDKLIVLGARPREQDIATLTDLGIAVAWIQQWEPNSVFAGTDLAQTSAPWLFA